MAEQLPSESPGLLNSLEPILAKEDPIDTFLTGQFEQSAQNAFINATPQEAGMITGLSSAPAMAKGLLLNATRANAASSPGEDVFAQAEIVGKLITGDVAEAWERGVKLQTDTIDDIARSAQAVVGKFWPGGVDAIDSFLLKRGDNKFKKVIGDAAAKAIELGRPDVANEINTIGQKKYMNEVIGLRAEGEFRDSGTLENVTRSIINAPESMVAKLLGALQGIADNAGVDDGGLGEIAGQLRNDVEANGPVATRRKSTLVSGIADSVSQFAMALPIAAGSAGMMATIFATQSFGSNYSTLKANQKENGFTDAQISKHSLAAGLFEGLFERIGVGLIFKNSGKSLVKGIATAMIVNPADEVLTSIGEITSETLLLKKKTASELTTQEWSDISRTLWDTVIVSLGAGPGMAIVSKAMGAPAKTLSPENMEAVEESVNDGVEAAEAMITEIQEQKKQAAEPQPINEDQVIEDIIETERILDQEKIQEEKSPLENLSEEPGIPEAPLPETKQEMAETEQLQQIITEMNEEANPVKRQNIQDKVLESEANAILETSNLRNLPIAKIKEAKGILASIGSNIVDNTNIDQVSELGQLMLDGEATDFQSYTQEMVNIFGDSVKPFVKDLYIKSSINAKNQVGLESAEKVLGTSQESIDAIKPATTRTFFSRVAEAGEFASQNAPGNNARAVITNRMTKNQALKAVENMTIDEAIFAVTDDTNGMLPEIRVAAGLMVQNNIKAELSKMKSMDSPKANELASKQISFSDSMSALGTSFGRGTQALSMYGRMSPQSFVKIYERQLVKKSSKINDAAKRKIWDMAEKLDDKPEGYQRNDAVVDILNFIASEKGISKIDLATSVFYANMLSALGSHFVNVVGNVSNIANEAVVAFANDRGAGRDIAISLYHGMINGLAPAVRILQTGKSPIQKFDKLKPNDSLRALRSKPARIAAAPFAFALDALAAEDAVFFSSAFEMRSRLIARSVGKSEGLEGRQLAARTDQILKKTDADVVMAHKVADDEGLTGIKKRIRITEVINQARDAAMNEEAVSFGLFATFNNKPDGLLGIAAELADRANKSTAVTRLAVAFTNVVANVLNIGLDNSPYGFKRAFLGYGIPHTPSSKKLTGEDKRREIIRASMGTAAMSLMFALSSEGEEEDENGNIVKTAPLIEISGSGPNNFDHRNQLVATGWKPNSIKIGGTWWSSEATPFLAIVAVIGNLHDGMKYNGLSEKKGVVMAGNAVYGVARSISSLSFLKGVGEVFEAIERGPSSKNPFAFLGKIPAQLLIPSLAKEIGNMFNPQSYKATTALGAFVRNIPSKSLNSSAGNLPEINVLGEPTHRDNKFFRRFKSDVKDNRIWNFIADNDLFISDRSIVDSSVVDPHASNMINGQEYFNVPRQMSPQEFWLFKKMRGDMIKSGLENFIKRMKDDPSLQENINSNPEQARKELSKAVRGATKRAQFEIQSMVSLRPKKDMGQKEFDKRVKDLFDGKVETVLTSILDDDGNVSMEMKTPVESPLIQKLRSNKK